MVTNFCAGVLSLLLTRSKLLIYLYPSESAFSVREPSGWITFPFFAGRDSSVGTAACYGMVGSGIESRWGRGFPRPSRSGLWPTQPSVQMGAVSLSLGGVRRPGRGVEHTHTHTHLVPRYGVWYLSLSAMLTRRWLVGGYRKLIFAAECQWGVQNSRESLWPFCLDWPGFVSFLLFYFEQ